MAVGSNLLPDQDSGTSDDSKKGGRNMLGIPMPYKRTLSLHDMREKGRDLTESDSLMTKALVPTENSKKQIDNTKTSPKTSSVRFYT